MCLFIRNTFSVILTFVEFQKNTVINILNILCVFCVGFLEEVNSIQRKLNHTSPLLVLCGTGAGRSGVLILSDLLLHAADSGHVSLKSKQNDDFFCYKIIIFNFFIF